MRSYVEKLRHIVLDETEAFNLDTALRVVLNAQVSDLPLRLSDAQLAVLRTLQTEVEA